MYTNRASLLLSDQMSVAAVGRRALFMHKGLDEYSHSRIAYVFIWLVPTHRGAGRNDGSSALAPHVCAPGTPRACGETWSARKRYLALQFLIEQST